MVLDTGSQEGRIPVFQVVQTSLNQVVALRQALEQDEGNHPMGVLGGSFLPSEQLLQSSAVEQGYVWRKMRGPGWLWPSEERLGGDCSTQEEETGSNGSWALAIKDPKGKSSGTPVSGPHVTDQTCYIHVWLFTPFVALDTSGFRWYRMQPRMSPCCCTPAVWWTLHASPIGL